MLSYHIKEERVKRHNLKKVVKEHFKNLDMTWEYTLKVWEEEKVDCGARTYDEVIFKRRSKSVGRIFDEEKEKEDAKRKEYEEAIENTYVVTTSPQLGSIQE
jgi:hypothetical protein